MNYEKEEMQKIIADTVAAYIKNRKSVMIKLPGKGWELTDTMGYMKGVLSGGFEAYCVVFPSLDDDEEGGILSVLYNIEGLGELCKASVKIAELEEKGDHSSLTLNVSAALYDKAAVASSFIKNLFGDEDKPESIDLTEKVEAVSEPVIKEVIDE